MSNQSDNDDDDPSIGSTEMRALRRLTDPVTAQILPPEGELWASRYRIVEPIGHGGMGDVFLAQDVLLDRPVALKILRTTSEEVLEDARSLVREARATARADHERVARIYDVGTWCNQSFIAMEYVRGETLRVWMKARQPTTQEIISIAQQLVDGLKALHQRGVVHRDLKPENIMVTPEGRLRILDLGVARRIAIPNVQQGSDANASRSLGVGVGTPGYMAPEQWQQGDVDARADIFALGVIAYELIASCHPLRGGTMPEVRERTLHGEISFDDECWKKVPAELQAAVRTALAREPERRHQTVDDFATALGHLLPPSLPPLSAMSVEPPPPVAGPPSSRMSLESSALSIRVLAKKQRRWLLPLGMVAAALGVFVVLRLRKAASPPATPGMVRFNGASYTMGLDQDELAKECKKYPDGCLAESSNETPPRPVTVEPFELDVREVTNEEFANFLSHIGSLTSVTDDDDGHPRFVRYRPGPGSDYLLYDLFERLAGIRVSKPSAFNARADFEKLPVTLVTWLGAHLYCRSIGKRLPTEAEWELAARGVERRPYPWGDEVPTCAGLHIPSRKTETVRDAVLPMPDADDCDNARKVPFPVMSAQRDKTPQGIFDLGGNVIEWVDDNEIFHDGSASLATRASAEKAGIIGAAASALLSAFEPPLASSGWRATSETTSASAVRSRQSRKGGLMKTAIRRHVSNQGPVMQAGDANDVWFVASTETFDEAKQLKSELDEIDPLREAVIFRSVVRQDSQNPVSRPSHETWHIDDGQTDSAVATEPDVEVIGFDVFTAPVQVVTLAQKSWDRGGLCADITNVLLSFSQTGDPGGAQ